MTTPKQALAGLKTWLQAVAWESTSQPIFGSGVYIVLRLPIEQLAEFPVPCAFIVDAGAIAQENHSGILYQNVNLLIYTENFQSNFGESVLIGGCERSGFLDIADDLYAQLVQLTAISGAKIVSIEKGRSAPTELKGNYPRAIQIYKLQILTSVY